MPIKVLHLIDSGGLYGAEIMLLNLVEEQMKAGLEPMILSAGTPGDGEKALEVEAKKRGLPVMPFRMKAGLNLLKGLEVIRYAKNNSYDILHSHGYKFNILLGLIPKVINTISTVTTVHGYVHVNKFSKMWVYQLLDRMFLKKIDAVVLVSKDIENKIKLRKSIVINNGINITQPERPIENVIDDDLSILIANSDFVIGSFGRLTSEKGFEFLIKAYEKVVAVSPKTLLIIWGEGYLRENLEKRVEDIGLASKIIFPGFTGEVNHFLGKINVLALPSLTEGLPIILLEAVRSKTPVVATNVGSIPEVLDNGKCGTLVSPKNVDELANALIGHYATKGECHQSTILAYERFEEYYSSKIMSNKYQDVYEKLRKNNE
jgi:glycosyltransferase involved in cell wall biosynthesis